MAPNVVFCLIILFHLEYILSITTIQSNILWGNYRRPPWSGDITFEINEQSNQVTMAYGYVLPISSRGRGNIPLPYSPIFFLNNTERGHIIGLSNGGPDIPQNVVPQHSDWQISGGWAELQETIHNITAMTYGWTGCMCPDNGTYTVETVFNIKKPACPMYLSINISQYDTSLYPSNYSGFFYCANSTKYTFHINENERVEWQGPHPPKHLACKNGGTPCCNRWNCCEQQQIEQVFANNMNISHGFGTIIYENDTMTSNNGLYEMKLESSGSFAIHDTEKNQVIWQSNTSDSVIYSPHKLIISYNGSMFVENNNGQTTVVTSECGDSYDLNHPFRFIMENNGNLVLYDHSNHICWSSHTIISTSYDDKQYFLCSSNVLINDAKTDNASYFMSNGSCIAEVLKTGQFVVKDLNKTGNDIVWYTNTTNMALPPYRLSLQMDGKMVLYGNKQPMWQVNGSHSFNVSTMQNWMLMLHREKETCVLTFYDNQMRTIWSSL
eukprot:254276_1